jgi:hypothetical protein
MGAFLLTIVGPLALRALLALGIGTLTFTGVDTAFGGLVTMVINNFGGLPAAVLQLISLASIPTSIGIVLGAFTSRIAIWAAAGATRWITKA